MPDAKTTAGYRAYWKVKDRRWKLCLGSKDELILLITMCSLSTC